MPGPLRAGSVAGGLHGVEEGLGFAEGGCGGVDVDAVGVGGFGGGGHLAGGAVGGGHFGVGDDLRVGGLGLGAGGAVEVVELGRVGGVDLVLDHDHVGRACGGAGEVAAQVPAVQVLAADLRAGGAGDHGQVAGGGVDDLQAVGVRELAELGHVGGGVLLFVQRGGGPVLGVVHDPGVGRGDGVAGKVGGELGVGVVDQHAGGGEAVADRGGGCLRAGGIGGGGVEEVAGGGGAWVERPGGKASRPYRPQPNGPGRKSYGAAGSVEGCAMIP